MARRAGVIAEDIDVFMKKKTLNVWTLPWSQMYEVAERKRIKDSFLLDLCFALKVHGLVIHWSDNAFVIHRDANFGPQEWSRE